MPYIIEYFQYFISYYFMKNPKSDKAYQQHFFAHSTDYGIQASFSDPQGRKNYLIPKTKQVIEDAPLAVESFSMTPEKYDELMERVNKLYQ